MARTKLAITLGDPAGIGPEIVLKAMAAVAERPAEERPHLVVCGAPACLEACGRRPPLGRGAPPPAPPPPPAAPPARPNGPAAPAPGPAGRGEPIPVGRESA